MRLKLLCVGFFTSLSFVASAQLRLERNFTCTTHYIESDGDEESDTYEFHFENRVPMIVWSSTQRSGTEKIGISKIGYKQNSTVFSGQFPWSVEVTYEIEISENLNKAALKVFELNGTIRSRKKLSCHFL